MVDGNLVSREVVAETVHVPVTEKVIVNGVEQTRTRIVPQTRMVTRETRLPLKGATVQEAGGKKLDEKEAARRLERPTALVLSTDGRPITAEFVKLFQKDTILFVPARTGPAK